MSYSLNEIEAMAKRAARGAGYVWGISDEAGYATRWLCAQGLDGVELLADLLTQRPEIGDPLLIGTSLSDQAARLMQQNMIFTKVTQPMLLLPFAAMAAQQIGEKLLVTSGADSAVTDGQHLSLSQPFADHADRLVVQIGSKLEKPRPISRRATASTASWAALSQLAQRTYAPATEQSRQLGAGAGPSDNE